jgi:hypothetical protein
MRAIATIGKNGPFTITKRIGIMKSGAVMIRLTKFPGSKFLVER